jgi:hypothetical protein
MPSASSTALRYEDCHVNGVVQNYTFKRTGMEADTESGFPALSCHDLQSVQRPAPGRDNLDTLL